MNIIVYIVTDMEGLAGIDRWEQCYDLDDSSANYKYGREQLTADVNAAVAGCFDAGAREVRVMDGHGRNRNRGFIQEKLDRRATSVWLSSHDPTRLEGMDETVDAVAMIGQHPMAGTLHGFLDHTQFPKELCRFLINGQEHGELSQQAVYSGHFGVPVVFASGDEALCEEARRLLPDITTTATKEGTGWETCRLYTPETVRANIRRDIAAALRKTDRPQVWRMALPIEITIEWAWSAWADRFSRIPGVQRLNARTVRWKIGDARDIYSWPSIKWQPLLE